jgi:hypothetical protein
MYAAVQILESETAHTTIERIMRAAKAQNVSFRTLELLGIVPMGRLKLVRFRTDKPITQVLNSFRPYRSIILQEQGSYMAHMPDGTRSVAIPSLTMTCVAEPALKRTYRGVGVQFWERQFT